MKFRTLCGRPIDFERQPKIICTLSPHDGVIHEYDGRWEGTHAVRWSELDTELDDE